MLPSIAILCLAAAVILLAILSLIDLRVRLLPNVYVLPFALTGIIFHAATQTAFLSVGDIAAGAATGFLLLYLLRAAANWYYQQDALGLGDVKLMGAAGIWLGLDGILFALTLGALAGVVHGLGYAAYTSIKHKTPFTLSRLEIPAGPGFAVGIVGVGVWLYGPFVLDFVHDIFA